MTTNAPRRLPRRPDEGDPCPACGKPLIATGAWAGAVFFVLRAWLMCSGAPDCDFVVRTEEDTRA